MTGGATVRFTDELTGGLTLRHLGPAPLVEDDSARAPSSVVGNLLVRYRAGDFELTGEVLNAFDSSDADISYFYASRLEGEPLEGVEDVHLHPIEPRTIRIGVRRYF